jgi:hypothetical protein
MKTLLFGPSGSGKTFIANALRSKGINAFDADDLQGLGDWYDRNWKKVATPKTTDEALSNHYSYLWSREFLTDFLGRYADTDVYLFGGSGNLFGVTDLFDKIYFLKVDPALQQQRLASPSRPTPSMDQDADGLVVWGSWLEEEAKKRNVPLLDAAQTPEQIFDIIRGNV